MTKGNKGMIEIVINSESIPNRVYGGGGVCPCQIASQHKDPIKILVDKSPTLHKNRKDEYD